MLFKLRNSSVREAQREQRSVTRWYSSSLWATATKYVLIATPTCLVVAGGWTTDRPSLLQAVAASVPREYTSGYCQHVSRWLAATISSSLLPKRKPWEWPQQHDRVKLLACASCKQVPSNALTLARVRVLTAHQNVPAHSAFPLEKVWSRCQHRRGQLQDFTHFRHFVQLSCSVDSSGSDDMITNFLQL